jgi:hypothetical protein
LKPSFFCLLLCDFFSLLVSFVSFSPLLSTPKDYDVAVFLT